MAAQPLENLGLCEAELRVLGRAAQSCLTGRLLPVSGKFRHRTPASAGGSFQGFREYVAGDNLRAVNWRASARSNQIQTQLYESELASKWYICLDGSASMSVGRDQDKWLLARQLAAAFGYLLLYGGHQVGLMLYSGKVDAFCPPGRSHSQYPKLLNLLKDCRPHPQGGESSLQACTSRLSPRASVLVISDFLDEGEMQATLGRWYHTGLRIHALQTLAVDECDLPLHESITIRDIESGEQRLLNAEPDAVRRARLRLRDLTASLAKYCHQRRIPFTAIDPGKGWKAGVIEHLQRTRPWP